MEQVRALNALEPFLALAKSANSPRAASDLITRATSQPTTFIFTELLLTPQIQALSQSPDHAHYVTLLQIFSYGTYTDYISHNTTSTPPLPDLNPAQLLKLRQLTLLTLARSPGNLTYKNLLKVLELNSVRALEDLVISCIYADLIVAKLDPYNQIVSITSVAPLRDISPNSIPSMIATFHSWSNRCTTTLKYLEHQIATVKNQAMVRKREEVQWQAKVEGMLEEDKNRASGGGGKGNSGWDDGKGSRGGSTRGGLGFSSMLGSAVDFATGGGSGSGKRGMGMGIDEEMDMDLDDTDHGEGRGGKQKKRFGL